MPAKKKPAAKSKSKIAKKPLKAAKAKSKPAAKPKSKAAAKPKTRAAARAKPVKPAKAAPKGKASPARASIKPVRPTTDPAVEAYMRFFAHPLKGEIEAVRSMVLGLRPDVREGIKWNAPSFATTDHFATFNFHGKDAFRLILHTGAGMKSTAVEGVKVSDPSKLLQWQAKDRALVAFKDAPDVHAKLPALEAVLRQWVEVMDGVAGA